MVSSYPVLYSFRRCPYAIRARLAIKISGVEVELREVILKDKPKQLLDCSPKGTVPVLQLDDTVIDESCDIMEWALAINDPKSWLPSLKSEAEEINRLISLNDHVFKTHLDHYKYSDRHPEKTLEYYREQGELFLHELEVKLRDSHYLISNEPTIADMAIFPFIRQFAYVDITWFEQSSYKKLNIWLSDLINSDVFQSVMRKYPQWPSKDEPIFFL